MIGLVMCLKIKKQADKPENGGEKVKIKEFAKKNAVMVIAFAAALVTSFFVPVDREYINYFDKLFKYAIENERFKPQCYSTTIEYVTSLNYIENEVILRTYQAIVYFYNSLNNEHNEIYKYCYDMTKNNFIYEVMKGVNELISYDADKRDKMLNDCIERFNTVKYNMKLQEYVVETLEGTPETLMTLDEKLRFARINNKKGK